MMPAPMLQPPLVTVMMAVYDGDRLTWLSEAVESILRQTYTNFEFLIVTDGPLNRELLQQLVRYQSADKRVNVATLQKKHNLANALNYAISAARGEYLIRMDADDISTPNRIQTLVEFMQKHPTIDVAGSFVAEFQDGQPVRLGLIRYPCQHDEMRRMALRRNPLAHASAIFRRAVFDENQRYPIYSPTNQDTILWLTGFVKGWRFANVPEVLYHVRVSPSMVGRRRGWRKAWSDFVDRNRVILDLNGGLRDMMVAVCMLCVQLLPRSIYLIVRKRSLYRCRFQSADNFCDWGTVLRGRSDAITAERPHSP